MPSTVHTLGETKMSKAAHKARIHKLAQDIIAEGGDRDDVLLALTEASMEFMEEARQILDKNKQS